MILRKADKYLPETRLHTPEDSNPYQHSYEKLKIEYRAIENLDALKEPEHRK
jgi:hypothetical protein